MDGERSRHDLDEAEARAEPLRLTAELVHDGRNAIGEGPLWHDGRLVWVDIPAGTVHFLEPSTGRVEIVDTGAVVGAVAPRASGGLVAAVADGFAAIDVPGGRVEPIAEVEADRSGSRMNDGKCDARGRFWAGTMTVDESSHVSALYRLDADLRVARVVERVGLSNGLAWSAGSKRMYYIDSLTYAVDVLDFDAPSGSVSNRRTLIEIARADGMPDGVSVDSRGRLWIALWGGSEVRCYTTEGRLEATVSLPVSQVTSCAFGGPDLSDLYITSATEGLDAADLERQPHAGGLFRCRPGVSGTPAHVFLG